MRRQVLIAVASAVTVLGAPAGSMSAAAQSAAAQPAPAQPMTALPRVAQPGPAQPGPAQPGPAQPGSAQPGAVAPRAVDAASASRSAASPGALAGARRKVAQPKTSNKPLRGLSKRIVAAAGVSRQEKVQAQGLDDHGGGAADAHAHGGQGGTAGKRGGVGKPVTLKPAVAAAVRLGDPAALVAVTADRSFAVGTRIEMRVKESGGWSEWFEMSADSAHGPDPGSPEAKRARVGSDPVLTTRAKRVQVRIDTPTGKAPRGLELTSVSSRVAPGDSSLGAQVRASALGDPQTAAVAPGATATQVTATQVTATQVTATHVGGAPAAAPAQVGGAGAPAAWGDADTTASVATGVAQTTAELVGAPTAAQPPPASAPRPTIITRAQWGADESWRAREPYYTDNVRVGFVHHTASTNKYTRDQAAAQVRAIYSYHTRSLKHSDIDYNFVVDRFGRLYEGRAGGIDRAVLGGHTAGFNSHSFAAVVLGNFSTLKPAAAEMNAIKDTLARLFAWKLGLAGVNPASSQQLVSAGFIRATRYNKGTTATLPALTSHRAVNFTACPGTNIEAQIPDIRRRAAAYSNIVVSAPSPPLPAFQIGERTSVTAYAHAMAPVSWRADVLSPCSDAPVRTITGSAKAGRIPITWDLRDSTGRPVPPAEYTIRMSGSTADGAPIPYASAAVVIRPAPGGAWGPCGNASRVTGADPAETSVLWGRIAAPSSRTAVLTGYSDEGAVSLAAGLTAAPLARSLESPLLITPSEGLAGSVASELRRRKVNRVYIVGSGSVVSSAAQKSVAAIAPVTRLSGNTPAATAAAVARQMGKKASTTVDPAQPAAAIASAALAAARGAPIAIGASDAAGEASQVSLRLAQSFPGNPSGVMLLPLTPPLGTSAVAASLGVPVLFTDGRAPSAQMLGYLTGRKGLRSTNTTATTAFIGDVVLGAASRVMLGQPWAPAGVQPAAGMTAKRKVSRANASPEPIRAGRAVRVTAKVRAQYSDGKWRAIPAGHPFDVQFKAKGAKRYRTVASGVTAPGKAALDVGAKRSGRWRVVVDKKASASDYVAVRK